MTKDITQRSSGVLAHIVSLPSPYGIGDLGPSAFRFVDFLNQSRQRSWQILPINPTDGINGHSPYSCSSAFAGNTLLISPDLLIKEGWLNRSDIKKVLAFSKGAVDYPLVRKFKEGIFDAAFKRFRKSTRHREDFYSFCQDNASWLDDFTIFVVIKDNQNGKTWSEWPKAFKHRQEKALGKIVQKFKNEILRVKFLQYVFFRQWNALKEYANVRDIRIIGDIPIYVNFDSADVWRSPQVFKLDKNLNLKFVSGVPPDYFSRTGQRWGNPIYDWKKLKRRKFSWWVERIERNLKLFDFIRIDHFRGFASYWEIPAFEKLAVFGEWEKGPGAPFFRTLLKKFPNLPIIAEDLGYITPDVVELMKKFKFPGMRVLLFGFGDDLKRNPHLPEQYVKNSVVYTGTHDNNTIQGWYRHEASEHERCNLDRYFGQRVDPRHLHWDLIELLMCSVANMVILPLGDILGLGQEARINRPATTEGNWRWRLLAKQLTPTVSRKLKKLTVASKRS